MNIILSKSELIEMNSFVWHGGRRYIQWTETGHTYLEVLKDYLITKDAHRFERIDFNDY